MRWSIKFQWPEGNACYAGIADNAFGFATDLVTAKVFTTEESAKAALRNGYGANSRQYGFVVGLENDFEELDNG